MKTSVITRRTEGPLTIITRPVRKKSINQTVQDRKDIAKRVNSCGSMYQEMEKFLLMCFGRLNRCELLQAAFQVFREPPDRLAKRSKEALICFYCEQSIKQFAGMPSSLDFSAFGGIGVTNQPLEQKELRIGDEMKLDIDLSSLDLPDLE